MEQIFIKVYKKDCDLGYYNRNLIDATYSQRQEFYDNQCDKRLMAQIIEKFIADKAKIY